MCCPTEGTAPFRGVWLASMSGFEGSLGNTEMEMASDATVPVLVTFTKTGCGGAPGDTTPCVQRLALSIAGSKAET